jgi:putative oxidoreductase
MPEPIFSARDLGLLALRAGVGGVLVAHGAQKLFGWFGGRGLEQTGAFEYRTVLGWSAAALALTGPGTLSLDYVLAHRLNRSWMRNLVLAAVVPAAFAIIARRRRTVASTGASE